MFQQRKMTTKNLLEFYT